MYKNLLLASDGTHETLVALREGALIAQAFGAEAHLLIIFHETSSIRIAESLAAYGIADQGEDLLKIGLERLRQLGVRATGELQRGDPAELIINCARSRHSDLIVLGHRRQSFLRRWWSGATGGYIVDDVRCSVLVARETVTDEEFELQLNKARSRG